MSTLPISSTAALAAVPHDSSSSNTPTTGGNLASEDVFLQLLVAQLQNQDPEQPTDGTAFVTELAQFTTLQEDTESATDLDSIVAALPTIGVGSTAPSLRTPAATPVTTDSITQ